MLFFNSSGTEVWKFQKIELPNYLYNIHCQYGGKCNKMLFLILSFPEQKKSGGSGISYIIAMEICFS